MFSVQLGPALAEDRPAVDSPQADAIARRVARFTGGRRPRRVSPPELKELSRRRPGAVRFTPPAQQQ